LIFPVGKVDLEFFDLVTKGDDFSIESEDFTGGVGDSLVKNINPRVVFNLSLAFSRSFGIETIGFSLKQVVDNINN